MPVRIAVALAALMAIAVTSALLWPRAGPATAGSPTPTPPGLIGDVNKDGEINSIDALFVLYFKAGLLVPARPKADVNQDGVEDSADATLILQFHAGLIDTLPPPQSEIVGDVNCDGRVNSADALLILQLHARLLAALACQHNADVNGDGSIDSIDATLMIQFTADFMPLPPH